MLSKFKNDDVVLCIKCPVNNNESFFYYNCRSRHMGINATVTCDLSQVNPRDFVECLGSHNKINVSIITNSNEYSNINNVDDGQIVHYSPPYSPTLYPLIPRAKRELSKIIEGFNTDILLSMGVGPLVFTGLATKFSPTILVPQGAETAYAVGPYYFTDKNWYKFILKHVYRPMFERLLANVDEVWGIQTENKTIYTRLGLDESKFKPFDWVPIDTDKFKPTGKKVQFGQDEDDIVIGAFRRLRGELVLDTCFPFLEAVSELSSDRNDFHVVLGGLYPDNDIRKQIDKKLELLNIKNNITKKEIVPKEKIDVYYRSCDIYYDFTFPNSPLGALGTGVKEAMASGNTLVTQKIGNTQRDINDRVNGIITQNNKKSIKNNLAFLLENKKERESIAEKGEKMVVDNFSMDAIARKSYDNMICLINEVDSSHDYKSHL